MMQIHFGLTGLTLFIDTWLTGCPSSSQWKLFMSKSSYESPTWHYSGAGCLVTCSLRWPADQSLLLIILMFSWARVWKCMQIWGKLKKVRVTFPNRWGLSHPLMKTGWGLELKSISSTDWPFSHLPQNEVYTVFFVPLQNTDVELSH